MNQTVAANQKILMFPCAGASNVGQLTVLAVQELVSEGRGERLELAEDSGLQMVRGRPADAPPLVVVDGCEEHCMRKRLEAMQCHVEFHLSLADLGLEKSESGEILDDELQLVKDAIIAEGIRLSKRPPMIMGGCGCR